MTPYFLLKPVVKESNIVFVISVLVYWLEYLLGKRKTKVHPVQPEHIIYLLPLWEKP